MLIDAVGDLPDWKGGLILVHDSAIERVLPYLSEDGVYEKYAGKPPI
jgi:hypothetical protein